MALMRRSNHTYYTRSQKLNTEVLLHDAMDNICQYLNSKDLCSVSRVCKSWNSAATRQINKRCYLQRLSIHYDPSDLSSTEHEFWNKLRVKPHVAIFFMETRLREKINLANGCTSYFENDVLSLYRKRLPGTMIGLEVRDVLVEEDALYSSPDLQNQIALESMGNSGMLGLFLPVHRQVRVHVTWSTGCCTPFINEVANKMIDNLELHESDNTNSTLILLGCSFKGYFISEEIMHVVRKRFEHQNITMWGGTFDKELMATRGQKSRTKCGQKAFIGLRISGPNVESWSLIIDCSTKKEEIEHKLYEYKERIRRKRCTMGLVYGPSRIGYHSQDLYNEGSEIMRTIRRIFFGIPFTGLFNRNCRILFGDDSIDCASSQSFDCYKYMSILILAYD